MLQILKIFKEKFFKKSKQIRYWHGNYSVVSKNGYIENFIKNYLKYLILNNEINTLYEILILQNDGIVNYESLIHYKNSNVNKILCTLCTRNISLLQSKHILYLPLDDETFHHGLQKIINENVKELKPWKNRIKKVFWRGGASGGFPSIRTQIVEKFLNNSNTDIKLIHTKGNWNKNLIKTSWLGKSATLETHCCYKYLLIIDGNVIASNLQWVFASGAVPILITHEKNNWWFKEYIQNNINCILLNYDNVNELEEKIQWLINNDKEAEKISQNALKFSERMFSKNNQENYLKYEIKKIFDAL